MTHILRINDFIKESRGAALSQRTLDRFKGDALNDLESHDRMHQLFVDMYESENGILHELNFVPTDLKYVYQFNGKELYHLEDCVECREVYDKRIHYMLDIEAMTFLYDDVIKFTDAQLNAFSRLFGINFDNDLTPGSASSSFDIDSNSILKNIKQLKKSMTFTNDKFNTYVTVGDYHRGSNSNENVLSVSVVIELKEGNQFGVTNEWKKCAIDALNTGLRYVVNILYNAADRIFE